MGFRELLVSDYQDDQKGSPFLHHKQREQQGTLRLDTVASTILLKFKITLFIFLNTGQGEFQTQWVSDPALAVITSKLTAQYWYSSLENYFWKTPRV